MVTSITVVLAGIAVFTALRLYQLRDTQVAPTAPQKPLAQAPKSCELFTFTITKPKVSPTPSVNPSPTDIPKPTEAPSPKPSPKATDTPPPVATETPVATSPAATPIPPTSIASPIAASPIATPVATPTLPDAGVSIPTFAGLGIGILLVLGALLLVF